MNELLEKKLELEKKIAYRRAELHKLKYSESAIYKDSQLKRWEEELLEFAHLEYPVSEPKPQPKATDFCDENKDLISKIEMLSQELYIALSGLRERAKNGKINAEIPLVKPLKLRVSEYFNRFSMESKNE
jgi:hypothetical protein